MRKIVWKRLITSLIIISIILTSINFLHINEVRDLDYPIVSSTSDSWSIIVKEEEFKFIKPIVELVNGSLYIIGIPKSSSSLWVSCFNLSGNKEWELSFNIKFPVFSYTFDNDNNLIIVYNYECEYFPNNVSIIKINSLGVVFFLKEYNLDLSFESASLVLSENNSLLFVGKVCCTNYIFMMKFNNAGQSLWNTSFYTDGYTYNIISDSNYDIYLLFENNSANNLTKINGSGEISWQIGLSDMAPENLMIDANNTLYVIGSKYPTTSILKINSSGTILKEIIMNELDYQVSWFLGDSIVVTNDWDNSRLYYYDLNLNLQWNFSLTGYLGYLSYYFINPLPLLAKDMQENIQVLTPYLGHVSLLKINKTGNLISKINWGGGTYIIDPLSLIIDSENNIYFFSNCRYKSRWAIWYRYVILVKNPINGGTPPKFGSDLEIYDYFLFSAIGISCMISLITVISILKSKKEVEKRID